MFTPDFKEFIESLNANHVRYLVVGGYAVALHGHPRYTKDLEVWVECSQENAQALLQALEQFGMGSLGLTVSDFLASGQVVQIGYPPNRIDILIGVSGVEFADCYLKRVKVTLDGVAVHLPRDRHRAGWLRQIIRHAGGSPAGRRPIPAP